MAYCTVDQLIARFSETEIAQLTDREDRETVNTAIANAAITDASGEIDSYLGGRYALPLAVADAHLTAICLDMTRYRLYDDHPTTDIRLRYEDAVAWLKLVATGILLLPYPSPSATTTTALGGLAYSDPTTEENLREFTDYLTSASADDLTGYVTE